MLKVYKCFSIVITASFLIFGLISSVESSDKSINNNKSPIIGSWRYSVKITGAAGGESGRITFKADGTYIDETDNPEGDGDSQGGKTSGRYRCDPEKGTLEFIGKKSSTVYMLTDKGEGYLTFTKPMDDNSGMVIRYTIYINNTTEFKVNGKMK